MRITVLLLLAAGAIVASGCNLTLAQDIAPPEGYVPPAPAPTLGPLFPQSAPNIEGGAAIFADKCAPCHGPTGLGDGPEGKQLPVTVAALGLPELARQSKPADWFTMVSQGNLDRFMPPFGSLSAEQRWDVISYALTLHTDAGVLARGRELFESTCAGCPTDSFREQEAMAALSNADLFRIVREGNGEVPAFGAGLNEDETWAVAAYLRTLTFSSSAAAVPAAAATPAADGTPQAAAPAGTPLATAGADASALSSGVGSISGRIENKSGAPFPDGFKVTLRGYDHESDAGAGPQEVFALEGEVRADGSFMFEEMELPENRIFLAEAMFEGITYRSDFAVVEAAATAVTLPEFTVHATTTDTSGLSIDSLQVFFDYANADSVQIFYVYHLHNGGDKAIVVRLGDAQEIPFVTFPNGAQGLGYEETSDSAGFVPLDGGFAIPPSEATYGLIAFASLPKADTLAVVQSIVIPISEARLFLPHGIQAEGESLTSEGLQDLQGTSFNVYAAGAFENGDTLSFELSGAPSDVSATGQPTRNQALIIGAGALGAALILAGLWMYVRERNRANEEPDDDSEAEAPEELMDAIVALDDLHRAGKLPAEAYQKRRAELMSRLRDGI